MKQYNVYALPSAYCHLRYPAITSSDVANSLTTGSCRERGIRWSRAHRIVCVQCMYPSHQDTIMPYFQCEKNWSMLLTSNVANNKSCLLIVFPKLSENWGSFGNMISKHDFSPSLSK
jgi:hypothetical protein